MSATILCVHEDRNFAEVNAEALEAEGYEVLRAHDGRQAFDLLRNRQPDFIVLDTYLPRQDGFEILAELRTFEALRDIPVLLVSDTEPTDEIYFRAGELGAIGVEPAPIAADTLVARIAPFAKPAESLPQAVSHVRPSGRIREVPIPELLQNLRLDRHSGVLMLDHGKKKKAVEFRDGWPVSVKSNLISECLGSYLVETGRCTREELAESVERMRAGEGLQGQILVAMEVLDEEGMVEVLEEHALEKFLEIFEWRDGQFEVRENVHVQRGSSLGLKGHPAKLIVEGVRRKFPIKQIDRYFAGHPASFAVPDPEGGDQIGEIQLSEEEMGWVRGLNGRTKISEIAASPEWLRRLAFGFISIEFLRVETRAGDETNARDTAHRAAMGSAGGSAERDEALRVELAELAARIRDKDHYGVLDVPRSASDEDIRVAYAFLAKRTHPDRFHGASSSVRQLAAQAFERISEAHAAIATADDRRRYAEELERGRRVDAVEDEGRRALQAETQFQRGEAKMAERDYEAALVCFGRAMENFPSEGEYRAHYGWCLYLCHPDNDVMLGEALEHCREGLKLAKDREKPYLLLGRLYKAMGKVGAAKKMFSRAVEIKPQCVEAMRELRIMNMRREKDKGVLKRIFRR